jgi:hypothetical protein
MKKLFTLLLLTLLPFSAMAEGDDPVIIDGICYILIPKGNIAEVTSNPNGYSGDVTIPATITYEGVTYSVVGIGNGAFSGNSSLKTVVISEGLTTIGKSSFEKCNELASITLPSTLKSIGEYALSTYTEDVIINISDMAMWYNLDMKDVFYSSPFPSSYKLFLNGTEINDVVIPENITELRRYLFSRCTSLSKVKIPSHVTYIANNAFQGCLNITSLTIEEGLTSVSGNVFSGCIGLVDIELPSTLTYLGSGMFSGCSGLKSISLPNNLLKIGDSSFSGCVSLSSITIPNSVTLIDSKAFRNCTNLVTVTVGNGIKEIYDQAFAYCKNLSDVYIHASGVPNTSNDAFSNSYQEGITLHVPENSIDAYKAKEPWKSFKEIEGFTSEPAQVVEIVTSEGEVIKTEITITIVDENTKTAVITAASIPASETGSTEIAIPANVGGYSITGIEANAFAGMTGVTDIYFPDTDQPISLGTNALKIDDEHVATVHVPVGLLGSYALNEQLSQNFADGKVKATVTAPSRYWTFSAGVDVVVPEGVGVYICKFENEDQVRITELGDDQLLVGSKRIIKANNGVLIACIDGTGGNAYDIVANPGGQWSMAPASYDAKSYGYDNMLEPVLVSKNYPATSYYVLKNGEFHKILANSSKMPAGKAVLRIPGTGVAGARILSIIGDSNDGTTGIHNHHVIEAESKWFDLQGRRIERPTKAGLYINNGKKVLVK